MASRPWLDPKRLAWMMKYRPDPAGPWVRVRLCKHAGTAVGPRAKIPREGELKWQEYRDLEHAARVGLRPAEPEVVGLREHLDAYVRTVTLNGKGSTIRHTSDAAARFVEFATGRGVTTVRAVTRALCRDYLEFRAGSVAHGTLKTERGYLMGAWTRAVEDELIAKNPWVAAKAPGRPDEFTYTAWTSAEIGAIVAQCRKPWQADLVRFLALTGLRASTALAARWDWVDPSGRLLTIRPGPEIKTAYPHSLSRRARGLLDRLRASKGDSALIFPNAKTGGDEPMAYESARYPISRAIARAKVKPGTLHDFRHSYARMMIREGVPVTVVQKQLGHTTLAMTMRYVSAADFDVERFVEDRGFDL